jgi:EAL domain-containing protein (putative c-di-GMP-specific phosphodiesterase class I)
MANESVGNGSTNFRPLTDEAFAHALVHEQFFLVYQPTIDLLTNAFAGVEALLRWRDPEHGVIGPDQFMTGLEASDQMVDVGNWALRTACEQGAAWHARGYRFAVSANISVKQLQSERFVGDVEEVLVSSQFDPPSLVLEFSQASLIDDDDAAKLRLQGLKALGVRLAVDDFAPQHAPLDELEDLAIDIIKLDRHFISSLGGTAEDVAIVHSLIQLAKTIGVQIIASGIEDVGQRMQLQIEHVDIGQGFHFSGPQEAELIDQYLEDFAIFSGRPL